MNNDNDIECIICQDETINSPFIKYQHTCGIFDIHQSCLDDWFIENSHSCIICRNDIISSSDSDNSSREITDCSRELTDSYDLDTNYDADIESANDNVFSTINVQNHPRRSYNNQISYNNMENTNTNSKFVCAILLIFFFILIFIFLFGL